MVHSSPHVYEVAKRKKSMKFLTLISRVDSVHSRVEEEKSIPTVGVPKRSHFMAVHEQVVEVAGAAVQSQPRRLASWSDPPSSGGTSH